MSENKTRPTTRSVAAFLASVANEHRRRDARTVMAIMKRVTGESPRMWGPSIIGYGLYHYRHDSGREGDMPLAGLSPRKAELVVYFMAGFEAQAARLRALGPHRHGKGCLYLRSLEGVDLEVLEDMMRDSVARVRKHH